MKHYIYGQDARVAQWVAKRVDEEDFDGCKAIGVERNGVLIAGVVYTMYTGPSICMHVAGEPGSHWLSQEFLYRVFAYPFLQLKCYRVTGLVRADNLHAQRFDEKLGFVREGLMRKAASDGTDMIVYGMLREDCRFLKQR